MKLLQPSNMKLQEYTFFVKKKRVEKWRENNTLWYNRHFGKNWFIILNVQAHWFKMPDLFSPSKKLEDLHISINSIQSSYFWGETTSRIELESVKLTDWWSICECLNKIMVLRSTKRWPSILAFFFFTLIFLLRVEVAEDHTEGRAAEIGNRTLFAFQFFLFPLLQT